MSTPEPIYYVSASFSGVAFAKHETEVPTHCSLIPARQVDPTVREQGRDWLAANR